MAETPKISALAPQILLQKARYTPLNISYKNILKTAKRKLDMNLEGLATISLFNNRAKFFVELASNTAPKLIFSKLGLISAYAQRLRQKVFFDAAKRAFDIDRQINFLLVVPYLTSEIKDLTQDFSDVSVLDLCGNYIIKTKNISALCLDRPNEYRTSQPIRNIYKGVSSLVARTFLEGPREYDSVTSLVKESTRLGCTATFSTVSKVVSALEADLIVERSGKAIKLIQPDKLLQKLVDNYTKPFTPDEIRLKVDNVMSFALELFSKQNKQRWNFSGESSLQQYVVATQPQIYTLYTDRELPSNALAEYRAVTDARFFNIVIQRVAEPGVFFASAQKDGLNWAGRTQTYLELMTSDKRGKELAAPLRTNFVNGLPR